MKIIEVINTMISNQNYITNVVRKGKEYFFLYNNKHKWSISLDDLGVYYLHLYPNNNFDIDYIASIDDWDTINFVTYNTKELKTLEAMESFSELHKIVSARLYGVDDIFDDILNG